MVLTSMDSLSYDLERSFGYISNGRIRAIEEIANPALFFCPKTVLS